LQSIITVTNTGGTGLDTVVFNVTGGACTPPVIAYTPYIGQRLTPVTITPSITGTADSFHAETTLPTGLSIAKLTGVISGTPTVLNQAITTFPIKSFACGDSALVNAAITINDIVPTITSITPNYTNTTVNARCP
jgi:hypothetical protein